MLGAHTDRPNYRNQRCACAPRVNYVYACSSLNFNYDAKGLPGSQQITLAFVSHKNVNVNFFFFTSCIHISYLLVIGKYWLIKRVSQWRTLHLETIRCKHL